MMHSAEYYESARCMFQLGDWDAFVRDEFGSDATFANRLLLPYHVHVTSVDYRDLKAMASPWFEIAQEEIEVHSVWESGGPYEALLSADDIGSTFRQYYRILVFKRCEGGRS